MQLFFYSTQIYLGIWRIDFETFAIVSIFKKKVVTQFTKKHDALISYGIKEENVVFVNYFTDNKITAREKIENSDVIYFLGGLPDKMMERIKEFDLYDTILNYKGGTL